MLDRIRIPAVHPHDRPTPIRPFTLMLVVSSLAASACTAGGAARPVGSSSSIAVGPIATELEVRQAGYRLQAPIQRTVAVRDGGNVIIAGGLDSSGMTVGGVFVLHPASGRLTTLGSLAVPVHDATGVMIGSRLFVFGGGSSSSTDLVQVFDPATRSGTIAGHLPVALSDLASATVGGTIYIVGGYDGRTARREIYATTDGRRFHRAGTLPVGLRYASVASVGDGLLIAGGESSHGPSSAILSFDASTGKVHTVGRLPAAVGHAAAFALHGDVFVAGGVDASNDPVSTVTRIDPLAGDVTPQPPLPGAVADTAVAAGIDDAIFVGGEGGAGAVDRVLVASLRAIPPAPPSTSPASVSPAGSGDAAATRPFAGLLVVADRGNNRLLVVNAKKHIVWRYPSPNLPAPPHPLYFPDDAFWVHGGRAILVNEEENDTLIEVAYPSGKVLWTYGHPRVPGSASGYLQQPDDVYPYPGGGVVVADAKNCRILFIDQSGRPARQIGRNGVCTHDLPRTVGYPNGDTPLPNGDLLISELNGHWVDKVTPGGRVLWAYQIPGVVEPSDPQRLADGTFMVASYARPGAVVIFDRTGRVLWSYHPTGGPGMLDHPSLAAPLPNGLVAVNDDFNHRVVLIDRRTKRIVWQFGRTGVSGARGRLLSFPDGLDLLLPGGAIPLHVDFSSARARRGTP